MKALILSAGTSIHTARWVNGLTRAGVRVCLATQHPLQQTLDDAVDVIEFPLRGNPGYVAMAPRIRRIARSLRPDVLNAHFASGYGTTGTLVGWHPFVLSVWGSDVFSFPLRSPLHRWLVRKNLRAADVIASTSHCMADQVRALVPEVGDIPITPFGIDLALFSAVPPGRAEPAGDLVIGTVKAMEATYGVDTLIEAFAMLRQSLAADGHHRADRIRLRLVGGGSQTEPLRALAAKLGVRARVEFVGQVPHTAVPDEIGKLDIFVALSRQESFGVAVLEAGAAGRPVVVSDAGGLAEVVKHGETGLVVPREAPAAAAAALRGLVDDPDQRIAMGAAGRQHVREQYAWEHCVPRMLAVYEHAIRRHAG